MPCQDVPSREGWLAPWLGAAHGRGFQLNQVEIFKHRLHGKEVFKKKRKHQKNTRTKPLGCRELTTKAAGEAGMRGGWVWLREMLRLCL